MCGCGPTWTIAGTWPEFSDPTAKREVWSWRYYLYGPRPGPLKTIGESVWNGRKEGGNGKEEGTTWGDIEMKQSGNHGDKLGIGKEEDWSQKSPKEKKQRQRER